jgi:murein DD-endopeptidase MepM/ murein hydrolase activator NlpD
MSTAPRGRHRAARHAAPKKKSFSGKQIGTAFGFAGISTVVMTSGSTVGGIVQAGDNSAVTNPQSNLVAAGPAITQIGIESSLVRAQAASRSEDRQTLSETQELAAASLADNPVADVTAVIDATPTVSSTERKSLQALAATTDQLDSLISQAQDQKNQQAQLLISEQQAIINANLEAEAAVQAALAEAERIRQIGVVVVPVKGNYQLSARYGQRGGYWSTGWHTGLDFRMKSGSTVVAAANGEIISAGWGGAYGYRIEVDHGNGYITTYNHLSKIEVTSGKVAAGQEIGKSGSTGNTTGPHLHFEVTKDGQFENPSTWLWGK